MTAKNPNDSARRGKATRRKRSRVLPSQLEATDLDEITKRRCLMLLDVLSGRVPVTDAIAEAKISRGTYYQLEAKALQAMMLAVSPATSSGGGRTMIRGKEVEALEQKVGKLEMEKRRLEHLLVLATKIVKNGPLTTGRGRPRKRRSTRSGEHASPDSATTTPKRKRGRPSSPKPSAVAP